MADTEVQKLIIWVGTQAKITDARNQGLITDDDFAVVTNHPDFALASTVQAIEVLIPAQASSENQLADKDFVNSSINNMAAFYVTSDADGDPFPNRTSLIAGPWYYQGEERAPTRNDYALVTEDETHDDMTSRYMYDGTQWVWQYTLNNTTFTQEQIDAINSGITDTLVAQITTNKNAIGTLSSLTTSDKTNLVSAVNELVSTKQPTVSAGSGINITSNVISNSGVRSVSTGSTNGTISVNTNGTSAEVSVAGLGSAAYTSSTAYATAAQGTKADTAVQDVQVNNTSIVTNGVAKLQTSTAYGTGITGNSLYVVKASDADITAKSSAYKPIVPNNLDKAVMDGLGNNSLTWTDAYKESARATIGATNTEVEFVDWS